MEEPLNGPALAQALFICLAGAALESLAAGKSPRAYLATLAMPPGSPSFAGWVAVGIAYYAVCATLLYRLLARGFEASSSVGAALALLLLLMAVNAFWNYCFFRRRSPRAGYLVFFPYAAVALLLVMVLVSADRVGAWIFLPYLGYLVYALWWSRRVWQLNRPGSAGTHPGV